MSISLPKVGHVHRCPEGGGHEWEHHTYACTAEEELRCLEHAKP